ncbi:PLP-dependent aminotransferase family protein [Trinickia soli]|uniref:PLP-dependent aminotransferase family protein n=1 Tax=Trinickia soli TaxID=380675 RepID=A0A2N7WG28_9BURK|nr:PLP-dependent aminotransferase family protein [Trinickia soli]PMS28352.1 PLP-dependent aminotransferase family protein [Trinickia soli]CAB3668102.1 HTH-type transcriptional regulator NorG [Trinickia soli]
MVQAEQGAPLYQQLAQRLWEGVDRASMADGERLPSVRLLAAQYGVSLTTALQALRWLETRGYIEARPRSGYFVAKRMRRTKRTGGAAETKHASAKRWVRPVAELDAQARDHLAIAGAPSAVRLDLASAEATLYPVDRFSVLLRRLAYQHRDLLVGSHVRGSGYPALRAQIARQAIQYACELDPDELVVTNGCVEALNLALRAVARPGDVIAVESPTYFVLLQMLRALEMPAYPIPCVPESGIDVDALKAALDRGVPIKAVVTVANGNNPLGSVPSDAAKRALVELLRERDIALIEDDIFGDLCFGDTRPRPVRAFDEGHGNVLLCGGFSKSLCPGLRLGWIAGGRFTERVKALKYTTSMATAELQQAAVAQLLAGGGYALHLRRLKAALQSQQHALRDAVMRYFPEGTEVTRPAGGFVLWVKLPGIDGAPRDTRTLFERARAEGVSFAPGHLFGEGGAFDDCLRLNAGNRWTSELDAAVRRLGELAAQAEPIVAA